MSKVTSINTHKDYQPAYRGIAHNARDKQALLNKSLAVLAHNSEDCKIDPLKLTKIENDNE